MWIPVFRIWIYTKCLTKTVNLLLKSVVSQQSTILLKLQGLQSKFKSSQITKTYIYIYIYMNIHVIWIYCLKEQATDCACSHNDMLPVKIRLNKHRMHTYNSHNTCPPMSTYIYNTFHQCTHKTTCETDMKFLQSGTKNIMYRAYNEVEYEFTDCRIRLTVS
jgi:hypothetical protein